MKSKFARRKYAGMRKRRTGARLPYRAKKAVTQIVKSVISRNVENKAIGWLTENGVTHNSPIGAADCVPLVQQIAQGVSAQQRVGDRIKPKSLRLRGIVSFQPDTCNTSQNVYVRLLILAQKNVKEGNSVAAGVIDTAHLLRPALVGGDEQAFAGLTRNLYEPVNTDLFRVYMDRVIKLAPSVVTGGAREAMPLYSARYNFRMKQLPAALTYDDGNGNWANNFAPFFCMGYAFSDGSVDPTITQRLINTCSTYLEFEDA